MMAGYLKTQNINMQRDRVRQSLRRVDPEGTKERKNAAILRRIYHVPVPNSLWHIDGHMKLIR